MSSKKATVTYLVDLAQHFEEGGMDELDSATDDEIRCVCVCVCTCICVCFDLLG
jgi:hypothetical protein